MALGAAVVSDDGASSDAWADTATAPASSTAADKPLVETCDGSRTVAPGEPKSLQCTRWKVAWKEGGTVWGIVVADSHDAAVAERERQLGFARRHARLFEVPIDERYTDPSPVVCDTCDRKTVSGRWGPGQRFGDSAAREAITVARADLDKLKKAVDDHVANLDEAARLAREAKTAKAAKAYAAELRQAVLDLARAELALDNAAVFRSAKAAETVSRDANRRIEVLGSSLAGLGKSVAREVERAHGGKYFDDGAQGKDRPYLQVSFEGPKVTATYVDKGATSTWFEGEVALDGGIAGRSLVAPENGKLSCNEHTSECGFVHIKAVLRFSKRTEADKAKPREVAELWFQQSQWVQTKPFSR